MSRSASELGCFLREALTDPGLRFSDWSARRAAQAWIVGASFAVTACAGEASDDGGGREGEGACSGGDCAAQCGDRTDNDGDGTIDCADADCADDPPCLSAPAYGVPLEATCDDGADDDGDGAIDCADDDCASEPPCLATPAYGVPMGGTGGVVSTGGADTAGAPTGGAGMRYAIPLGGAGAGALYAAPIGGAGA